MTAGLVPSRSSISPAAPIGSNCGTVKAHSAAPIRDADFAANPFAGRRRFLDAIRSLVETRIGVRRLAFGL